MLMLTIVSLITHRQEKKCIFSMLLVIRDFTRINIRFVVSCNNNNNTPKKKRFNNFIMLLVLHFNVRFGKQEH